MNSGSWLPTAFLAVRLGSCDYSCMASERIPSTDVRQRKGSVRVLLLTQHLRARVFQDRV